jgi:DNA modification methylase
MKISVNSLNHHPRNMEIYTLSNIDDLVQSIGDVGLLSPLVIDKKNQVISGNRRLSAIRELGWQKVECEVVDVPDADVVSLLIAYNKQRVKSCREMLNEAKILLSLYKGRQGKRTDLVTCDTEITSGKTRDFIGETVGVSGSQIQKLLFIEKTQASLIECIDDGEISVKQAYVLARQVNLPPKIRPIPVPANDPTGKSYSVMTGECEVVLPSLYESSFDACITDPPYGIGMGKWDHSVPSVEIWEQVYRVMKPGGFLLSFGSPQLYHRMAVAIEDAGFLIKDQIMWMTTTRMPKQNRLKSAHEPIVVAQKPPEGTLDQNQEKWGCGLIDVDAGRVAWDGDVPRDYVLGGFQRKVYGSPTTKGSTKYLGKSSPNENGRYPSNIIGEVHPNQQKYFYSPRASRTEKGDENNHPTVKPLDLMRYLVKIYSPSSSKIIDPFCGTGTTGIACLAENREFLGIEKDEGYSNLARQSLTMTEPS